MSLVCSSIRLRTALLILAVSVLTACAAPRPMPFSEENPTVKADEGPLMIMTATVKNLFAPSHQPTLLYLNIEKNDASKERIRFYVASEDKSRDSSPEQGSKFLVRFQLKPGNYRLLGFSGQSFGFPIIGNFFMPLHTDFEVPASGTYYLGDANGVNRERKTDSEYRSGSVLPLLDQSVSGWGYGTFDMTVEDFLKNDLPVFQTRFPQLQDRQIEKRLLPQPDVERAKEYWQKS